MSRGPPEESKCQSDWEEAIASLEQKEIQLHQCQLQLMREQNGTFVRDLRNIRHDLDLLKTKQGVSEDRVAQLEGASKEIPGLLEQHRNELQAIRDSLGDHIKDFEGLRVSHAHHAIALPERMFSLETTLGEVTSRLEKEAKANSSAQAWNDALHKKTARDFEAAKANQGNTSAIDVGTVERMVNEASRRHLVELQNLRSVCEKHTKELQVVADTAAKQAGDLQTLKFSHGRHTRAFEEHRVTQTSERLTALERLQAEASDRHEEAMRGLKEAQTEIVKDLVSATATQFNYSEVEVRMTAAEHGLREASARHFELSESVKDVHKRHASVLAEMTRCINSAEATSAAQAALHKRGQLLEHALGDAAGRQSSELARLQSSHERLCLDIHEIKAALSGDFKRMLGESVGKQAQDLNCYRAEYREELCKLASVLQLVGQDLQDLKAQHELHAETHGQSPGHAQVAHLELADRDCRELDDLHGRLEALGGNHERHSSTVQELEGALRMELADIINRIEAATRRKKVEHRQ